MIAGGVLEVLSAVIDGDCMDEEVLLIETRAAVADALDALRMSADALEAAVRYVGGDLGIVLGDRALFARAALAKAAGGAP